MKNKSWLIPVLLSLIILSLFTLRYIGYAVQTPSRVSIPGVCGNGVCEWNENCSSCPEDCGMCPLTPEEPDRPDPDRGISQGPSLSLPGFEIDKSFLHYSVIQGDAAEETIEIKSVSNNPQNIVLSHTLGKFLFLSEEEFTLNSGETRKIHINVFAEDKDVPEIYTGKIYAESGNLTKYVNVLIDIKKREPLFDVRGIVTEDYVYSAQEIEVRFNLTNMGHLKNIDVLFYYAIKDFEGNIVTFKEESVAIDDRLELVRNLKIPRNLPSGQYILYTKVSYEDTIATSSYAFFVLEEKDEKIKIIIAVLIVPVVAGLIIFFPLIFLLLKIFSLFFFFLH